MRQIKFKRCFFSFCLMCFSSTAALANLSLDKVVIRFEQGARPVDNIAVKNNSDDFIKVTAVVYEVINPGQENEEIVKTRDLTVAPKAFELKARESRVARVVLRRFPKDVEKIFRINFVPDKAGMVQEASKEGKSIKVSIVIGMGALITAAPSESKPNLVFERKDGKILFTNKGNVTSQLQRGDFCNEDRSECIPLGGKRIYPGASWTMEVPVELIGKEFSQTVLASGNYNKITFPP